MKQSLIFSLTSKQREGISFLRGPQRHSLIYGGSRSGKTFELCYVVSMRAVKSAGSRHVIFRQNLNAAVKSIWLDTLPKVLRLRFPGLQYTPKEHDKYVKLPNGSEIWIAGLDDKQRAEKILGMEFATLYFNECSQIALSSVRMAETRLAQKIPGLKNRAYYDLNPVGTGHWTYRMFVEKKRPETQEALPDPENYAAFVMNPGDNATNLDPEYLSSLANMPERQRRRFFEGRYVAELDGALWTLEMIEGLRVDEYPQLQRIIVAIDPSGARSDADIQADEIGIVVAGLDYDDHAFLLEDLTFRGSPEQWARRAVEAYYRWKADRIVFERNFGGEMAAAVIRGADPNVPLKEVTASRGKSVRAEPVAALYERGRIHHVGRFPALEDELLNFTAAGFMGDRSPNRADALVWAISELIVDGMPNGLIGLWRQEAAKEPVLPVDSLADAQKKAVESDKGGWFNVQRIEKSEGLAKIATSPQIVDKCPSCGNPGISLFSQAWRCGKCENEGRL